MGADVMYPTLEQLHGNLRESFLLLTSQYAWVDGLWVGAVMCGAQHPVAPPSRRTVHPLARISYWQLMIESRSLPI